MSQTGQGAEFESCCCALDGYHSPNHNLMTIDHHFQPFSISFSSDSWRKTVRRYPIRATTEDVDIVHAEKEGLANRIGLLHKLSFPETNSSIRSVDGLVIG